MSELSVDPAALVDRRMALAREWDELVEQVRRIEGFEGFLLPPKLEDLLPAASGGPVVMVNVSRWRCDALIMTEDGVRVRELLHLTLDAVTDRTNTYLQTLQAAEAAAAEYSVAAEAAEVEPTPATIRAKARAATVVIQAEGRTDDMLGSLQEWLWDAVAAPVLDELGLDRSPPPGSAWPQVWWCPTGPLTLLPLHAAGYHGEPHGDNPRTVLDRVVSSYTPTLRALLEARADRPDDTRRHQATADGGNADGRPSESDLDRMLVVAVDNAPGQPRLRNVARERDALMKLFPPERRTVLKGPEATREAVDRELSGHRWVHFSCHGDQNLAEPSQGGLLLHDGMLTVADITDRQFQGDFAGLSACKTAVGGVNLLDEAITLAAALHYTGYRHVVAALWSVDDEVSATVFEAVYAELATQGRMKPDRAAVALNAVVRTLRDESPDEPRIWSPFTHTGP